MRERRDAFEVWVVLCIVLFLIYAPLAGFPGSILDVVRLILVPVAASSIVAGIASLLRRL